MATAAARPARAAPGLTARMAGALLASAGCVLLAALAGYDPHDPSLNVATGRSAANLIGLPGAAMADLGLQLLGLAAAIPALAMIALGLRRALGGTVSHVALRMPLIVIAALAFAAALAALGLALPRMPAGAGGLIGSGFVAAIGAAIGSSGLARAAGPLIAGAGAFVGLLALPVALGLRRADVAQLRRRSLRRETLPLTAETGRSPTQGDRAPRVVNPPRASGFASASAPLPQVQVTPPRPREQLPLPLDGAPKGKLPSVSLLRAPPANIAPIDPERLAANAQQLVQVLDDYGVEGEIAHVRPGPVVTMYELEPAPGIKASRVIGLADDIARSMSAVSARVAVVPGRTIIGIELPNAHRETVVLREMLESAAYADSKHTLPLILGKNIAGDPVVADLAPMPHLLIAGTTGAGKSVGLNAMILSILYKLTPEQVRLIMIDPKMLELSVYDGIPHLLSPVVTDPQKAIRALKWAVEEMENRYRAMASINVRSLAAFNQRVRDFVAEGKPFTRRVQVGFDGETGFPAYEEQTYDFTVLPHIVIVVDELADLMMVAGKEIEFLIQRVAQKARAAGIHLIMATQRPSVDVITGVIKANLPTRISFAVTSKIDSRTILGEQGAEQLLGKGDMLYMPGGKQVVRVHGPFVSDEEVEAVADHWRAQGRPDYVDAVTEERVPEDDVLGLDFGGTAADNEGDDYRRACQVVAESQKASTSYVQRQLRIGYNNAARLIERMEKDGIVSAADHVGRREVLVDGDGNRL
jgi:S-DNA-T family DNA segregation ATPase FtsK/SpoIIIE